MSNLSDREKVGTLRGLLYAIKFAIEDKDVGGLENELHDEILRVLDETKGGPDDDLTGEWRPGYAYSGLSYTRIVLGSTWNYTAHQESYNVTVVSREASGQVTLRPEPKLNERFDEWYPSVPFERGNPNRCPFVRVDAKMAERGAKDGLKEGDLLCHEAWGVWLDLTPGRVVK